MPLKIAVQMDPVEGIDIDADSTFALLLEAQARGHSIFYYNPGALSLMGRDLYATGRDLEVRREKGNHFSLGEPYKAHLAGLDVVLMRQDPPFDMAYISSTHMLEHVHPETLVVNDPAAVRNAPEKFYVHEFAELMPATLITRDEDEVRAFHRAHGEVIVKPLYGNGGMAVFRIREDDDILGSLIELFEQSFREPYIVQQYLPAVREGDKRIILVDGEFGGAINRIPADDDLRSNMVRGGAPAKTDLTPREREICARLAPHLRERGLLFTGIDVIGDFVTEINVTSPTGIRAIQNVGGPDVAAMIWDQIEAKRRN